MSDSNWLAKLKVTTSQLKTLRALAEPDNRAIYMAYQGRYGDSYWFLSGTHERATRQVSALIDKGLLTRTSEDEFGNRTRAKINSAGRKALAALLPGKDGA